MKNVLLFVCLCGFSLSASAAMSRVVAVTDSRTIVVEVDGVRSPVALSGVAVAASEETAAVDFLRRIVTGAWVLVENGDIYRSPDGLYVNGEMIRRAWRASSNMRYLGEWDPPARRSSVAAAAPGRRRPRAGAATRRSPNAKPARR
jgi:hypothetical protein